MYLHRQQVAIRLSLIALLCCGVASAQVVPYPIGVSKTPLQAPQIVFPFTSGSGGATKAQIVPSIFDAGITTNYIQIAVGNVHAASASGTEQCVTPDQSSNYYTGALTVEAADMLYCSGSIAQPSITLYSLNTTAGVNASFDVFNDAFHGPAFGNSSSASTTCGQGLVNIVTPLAYAGPCGYILSDSTNSNYPMAVFYGGANSVQEAFFGSNAVWLGVGNTTPVIGLNIASSGTSQASITVGDTNAGSTVLIHGPTGGISVVGVAAATVGNDYVCWATGGVLSIDTTTCGASTLKMKDNVLSLNTGLAEVLKLRPVSFHLKEQAGDPKPEHIGFIAEEMVKVEPRLVEVDKQGAPAGVAYPNVTALLVKAIQEQQKEIDQLKGEINGLAHH